MTGVSSGSSGGEDGRGRVGERENEGGARDDGTHVDKAAPLRGCRRLPGIGPLASASDEC